MATDVTFPNSFNAHCYFHRSQGAHQDAGGLLNQDPLGEGVQEPAIRNKIYTGQDPQRSGQSMAMLGVNIAPNLGVFYRVPSNNGPGSSRKQALINATLCPTSDALSLCVCPTGPPASFPLPPHPTMRSRARAPPRRPSARASLPLSRRAAAGTKPAPTWRQRRGRARPWRRPLAPGPAAAAPHPGKATSLLQRAPNHRDTEAPRDTRRRTRRFSTLVLLPGDFGSAPQGHSEVYRRVSRAARSPRRDAGISHRNGRSELGADGNVVPPAPMCSQGSRRRGSRSKPERPSEWAPREHRRNSGRLPVSIPHGNSWS